MRPSNRYRQSAHAPHVSISTGQIARSSRSTVGRRTRVWPRSSSRPVSTRFGLTSERSVLGSWASGERIPGEPGLRRGIHGASLRWLRALEGCTARRDHRDERKRQGFRRVPCRVGCETQGDAQPVLDVLERASMPMPAEVSAGFARDLPQSRVSPGPLSTRRSRLLLGRGHSSPQPSGAPDGEFGERQ